MESQYLYQTETGLILNFSQPQLQVKRVSFIETQKL